MLRLKPGASSRDSPCCCAPLFLLLLQCYGGHSHVIGPHQPIVATVGDDVILPCHLNPAVDAFPMRLEWARADPSPTFVHVWQNGWEWPLLKEASYEGRTSLSYDKLQHGDISLKLTKVRLSDEGTYRCSVPTKSSVAHIQLVVGAVSSPVVNITGMNTSTGGVVLQCESKGWYPEPEVVWLHGEGTLLSAGPTETVRGPDGLYAVSSRVTVEKRHSSSFTCRVQQKNINQTRETQIHVPDDFFMNSSCSAWCCISGAVSAVLFGCVALALILKICTKRNQDRPKNKQKEEEKDGKHNAQKPTFAMRRKSTLEKKHEVSENVYDKLPTGRGEGAQRLMADESQTDDGHRKEEVALRSSPERRAKTS